MKHIKSFSQKIYEKLNFDTNDIDDIFIDLVEAGFHYHIGLDWYNGVNRNQSLNITIWKTDTNITFDDLESIREDIYRLVDFMKLKGYNVIETYPARLIKNVDRASKKKIDRVYISFNSRIM